MYTYAAKVWELSLVQGPFSVAPCQTLALRFATVASLYGLHGAEIAFITSKQYARTSRSVGAVEGIIG